MQTERGIGQAKGAGLRIRDYLREKGDDSSLYFYMSPYKRSLQTFEALASTFSRGEIKGCQEEVQLREQDFGNFQVRYQMTAIFVWGWRSQEGGVTHSHELQVMHVEDMTMSRSSL